MKKEPHIFISEMAKQVPVKQETDVLVIGGGVAGISAALAAARNNQKVIIIEKGCMLGGLATAGHVCIYLPLCDGLGHKIYGGIAEELMYTTIKYGYSNIPEGWTYGIDENEKPSGRYQTHFNIPACVMAFDELMAENNIEVVFDTLFCEPIMEGNTCKGAIVENKSGRSAYLAKVMIDASGDADVMYRAGAPCEEQKSIVSHWTYELDFETMQKGINEGSMLKSLGLRWLGLRPDADNSKSELPRYYGTTSDGVNEYIRLSRSLALNFLKKNQRPDYTMMTLPSIPQFRTTRRILGKQEFQLNPGKSLENSIGCIINSLEEPSEVYEFPYEALIDAKITNIITAGRIVAAGGYGWETMRLIPACVFTGQAAGTAAALAIQTNKDFQNIDILALQKNLAATGIMIHMDDKLRNNKDARSYDNPTVIDDCIIRADALFYDHH